MDFTRVTITTKKSNHAKKFGKLIFDDEYQIRRKSLELGIPVLTTIELADSFVKTLEWLKDNHTTREPIEPYDKFE